MSNPVTMVYGDYTFTPVPMITIEKQQQKTDDGTLIGTVFNVTLEGTLCAYPTGGVVQIDTLQDTLRSGLATDGKLFEVACSGSAFIRSYPRINSVTFDKSNDNWVFTSPYTINLEWDEMLLPSGENSGVMAPYISDASEEWQVEFVEDSAKYNWTLDSTEDENPYQLRLTHTISATGKSVYISGVLVKPAWQWARDWVGPRLGYDNQFLAAPSSLNLNASLFAPFNHVRTNSVNESDGVYAVTESWIVINPSGSGVAGKAIEDFTITARRGIDSPINTITIEGTITGLEERSYGTTSGAFSISTSKYTNALAYWLNVKDRLVDRCNYVWSTGVDYVIRDIHPSAVSEVVGNNPTQGLITYNYEYNDRPLNCVSGAIYEDIVISDTNSTDVFASLPVIGRANGPILQDMGTITAASRRVSVEVIVPPATGCTTTNWYASSPSDQVDDIISSIYTGLNSAYDQVFKTNDTESWSIKTGRYTREVEWTFSNCGTSAGFTGQFTENYYDSANRLSSTSRRVRNQITIYVDEDSASGLYIGFVDDVDSLRNSGFHLGAGGTLSLPIADAYDVFFTPDTNAAATFSYIIT